MSKKIKIECDSCKHVIKMKKTRLREQSLEYNGRKVVLHYFMCPRCKKVYKIFIEGPKYDRYVKRIAKATVQYKRELMKQNPDEEVLINLLQTVNECKQLVEEYVKRYDKIFSGTFTVNVNGVVEYLP